jgi:hypothetical protein
MMIKSDHIILDNIPFNPELSDVFSKIQMPRDSPFSGEIKILLKKAMQVSRPKVLYRMCSLELYEKNIIQIENQCFNSRVLKMNLEKSHRVFPYIITCGMEMAKLSDSIKDPLQNFWIESINELALEAAIKAFNEDVDIRFKPGKTATMSPGSIKDWPLDAQINLFRLFDNTKNLIGVTLTESLLMIPKKSLSGIKFSTDKDYDNCQMCPREDCRNRKKEYDPTF